jgi:large subunit ribosomal protein L9
MQVILLQRIAKLGQMGDVVNVKDGYARNFLLPQAKALRATKENRARFEQDRSQLEARNLELKKEAEAVNERLNGQSFIVIRQAGESGQLYGSVATRDIADAVTAGGFSTDRRQIMLDKPIKTLGLTEVKIQLHPEVISKITLNIARSQDEAERQARGEQVLGIREEGPVYEGLGAAASGDDDMFEDEGRAQREEREGEATGEVE